MPTWKKYTNRVDDQPVRVNLDQVAYMLEDDDGTILFFAVNSGDHVLRLGIKESFKDMNIDDMFDKLKR